MSSIYVSVKLESKFGPVTATFTSAQHVCVANHKEGNSTCPLIVKNRRFHLNFYLVVRAGQWTEQLGVFGAIDIDKPYTNNKATPATKEMILAEMIRLVGKHTQDHPETLQDAHRRAFFQKRETLLAALSTAEKARQDAQNALEAFDREHSPVL